MQFRQSVISQLLLPKRLHKKRVKLTLFLLIACSVFSNEVGDGEGWYDVGEGQCFLQKGDDGTSGATEEYAE